LKRSSWALLVLAGTAFDILLAFVDFHSVNKLELAAMAQALIIVGVNVGLVGALASLLEDR
jgi:hypothetical protein